LLINNFTIDWLFHDSVLRIKTNLPKITFKEVWFYIVLGFGLKIEVVKQCSFSM